jgi:hypothetical protein
VVANIYGQDLLRNGEQRRYRRILLPLRVGTNIDIVYVDTNGASNVDVAQLVGTAFNNGVKRDNFVRNLQRKNPTAFATVTGVSVLVDGEMPIEMDPNAPPNDGNNNNNDDDDSGGGLDTWIIFVAAIGGGVLFLAALILVFIVLRRGSGTSNHSGGNNSSRPPRKRPQQQQQYPNQQQQQYNATMPPSKLQQPPPRYTTTTNINNSNKFAPGGINGGNGNNDAGDNDNHTFLFDQPTLPYSAEILLENRMDDVSTLGDPVGLGPYNAQQLGRDERTASFGENDYDYAKHTSSLLGAGPNAGGGFVANDDKEFEQQYELTTMDTERRLEFVVPPGKLGMVIDTPDNGPPLVHAVKTGSILDGKVQVGDLLMAVDDQNVTDWSAVQVSKFIAARSDRRRTLVFWRQNPRKRTESSIMLEGDAV